MKEREREWDEENFLQRLQPSSLSTLSLQAPERTDGGGSAMKGQTEERRDRWRRMWWRMVTHGPEQRGQTDLFPPVGRQLLGPTSVPLCLSFLILNIEPLHLDKGTHKYGDQVRTSWLGVKYWETHKRRRCWRGYVIHQDPHWTFPACRPTARPATRGSEQGGGGVKEGGEEKGVNFGYFNKRE